MSFKHSLRGKRGQSYDVPDENWFFSKSAWVIPDGMLRPMGNSTYSTHGSDEESHLFGDRTSLKQPLLLKTIRHSYFTHNFVVTSTIVVAMFIAAGLMTLLPCDTAEAINSIFKFTDTNSGIESSFSQELLFSNRTFRIALLGDSLINKPYHLFQLAEKVQAYLPGYNLDIVNCGFNGAQIAGIKDDIIPSCVTPIKPDAVLILWDSDASDVDQEVLNIEQINTLRMNYKGNVTETLELLIGTGAFVALGGPGVLGEGYKLFAPNQERFINKEPILDAYTIINKQAAAMYSIPYMDVRQAFLDYVPSFQLCYSLCVTFDGEHENNRGTVIVAKILATTLNNWLSTLKP